MSNQKRRQSCISLTYRKRCATRCNGSSCGWKGWLGSFSGRFAYFLGQMTQCRIARYPKSGGESPFYPRITKKKVLRVVKARFDLRFSKCGFKLRASNARRQGISARRSPIQGLFVFSLRTCGEQSDLDFHVRRTG